MSPLRTYAVVHDVAPGSSLVRSVAAPEVRGTGGVAWRHDGTWPAGRLIAAHLDARCATWYGMHASCTTWYGMHVHTHARAAAANCTLVWLWRGGCLPFGGMHHGGRACARSHLVHRRLLPVSHDIASTPCGMKGGARCGLTQPQKHLLIVTPTTILLRVPPLTTACQLPGRCTLRADHTVHRGQLPARGGEAAAAAGRLRHTYTWLRICARSVYRCVCTCTERRRATTSQHVAAHVNAASTARCFPAVCFRAHACTHRELHWPHAVRRRYEYYSILLLQYSYRSTSIRPLPPSPWAASGSTRMHTHADAGQAQRLTHRRARWACYTEKAPNAWQRRHKKQETPTINPIGPTDKPHRPSTGHYRKDSLGDA